MNSIDNYIEKAKNMDGGIRRTKVYPFEEDGVILVEKYEENFNELKSRIEECKKLGINIPSYIDYKSDNNSCWILEELGKGKDFQYLVDEEDITKIFAEMPYEHMEKYISDSYKLECNGVGAEPRRRNILYDKEYGFTIIDVALYNNQRDTESFKSTFSFFGTYNFVLLPPFSDDSLGEQVREKTILNVIRAFENGHPSFKKYERWLFRAESYYADFVQKHGVDLTLTDEEYIFFEECINELIDSICETIIKDPKELNINRNTSYINFLEASIPYCKKMGLYDIERTRLDEYIHDAAYNKIKSLYLENTDDSNLHDLYYFIRRKELDPCRIHPIKYIDKKIEEEINSLVSEKRKK